jgi:hypothetical protein
MQTLTRSYRGLSVLFGMHGELLLWAAAIAAAMAAVSWLGAL